MLLSVVALSLGLSSLVFTSMLAIDWIAALLRSRGVKQGEEVAPTEIVPISTRSLGLQSKIMFILSAALISIVISTSFIIVTGKAKEIVTPGYSTVIDDDYEFNFDRVYLHHPFMRCVGIAPWLSILVVFPATFFTLIAARFSPTANRIDRHSLKDKD
ncbi:hypothetical protein SISNIDRAFT_449887 [Sistotremastrum niveocremeum HHB9708]|uniref:Uncharacterized protein n=1 Tax=Sistotremastrum niveocremeum HHB9708 TaxID=1314777 RepID=A0A164YQI9_9AGAM|nr:hypothetical protein SISNIDRAFT_449887 [Sistotremastrum niveocremeum HHB9708]